MSVGNLKDYGNKGNNFPWQLKMLQGLQQMIDGNTICCQDTQAMLKELSSLLTPQVRNVKVISTSDNGATANGVYSVSIANIGSAAGLIGGEPLPAGVTLNFDAGVLNNTLGSIAYDATGTKFLITEMS